MTADGPLRILIALMRGINVSGQKIIGMENLRASFEALGFRRVRSYVQSGNVVFETTRSSVDNLSEVIRRKILSEYGFSVPVILRTADEMKKVANGDPFSYEKGIDSSELYVTFLSGLPTKSALGKLAELESHPDEFRVKGREVYLYCPDGYGRTKLSNIVFEKLLSLDATTRNWNTVSALVKMSS